MYDAHTCTLYKGKHPLYGHFKPPLTNDSSDFIVLKFRYKGTLKYAMPRQKDICFMYCIYRKYTTQYFTVFAYLLDAISLM